MFSPLRLQAPKLVKDFLKADLDEGEEAASAPADYTQSVLLMGEKKGYKRVETMQLRIIRTAKLLNMLKASGAIAEAKPYFKKLEETCFHLKAEIREQLLAEAVEE